MLDTGLTSDRYKLTAEGLGRFMDLRDEAVRFVVAAGETAFPEMYSRFGEKGRASCVADTEFHLDFLRTALETGDVAPFVGYLAWLVQVLERRGVPRQSITRSLDDLALFFQRRLGEQSVPVRAALLAGKTALCNGISAPGFDHPCPDRWREAELYSAAALLGKRADAISLLDGALARCHSITLAAVHVIQPAMYEVGRLWQLNEVSVSQEHLATAISHSWMVRSMARAEAAPDNGSRAMFGCLAENQHVMGVRMVADAFELAGWTTYNFGADTSVAAVAQRIRDIRPRLVGFSAALPQHLRGLRQIIAGLRDVLGVECPRIVVGGLVFNQFPGLAGWVGAEILGTDAVSAAAAGER